jgi:hypothetical protein
MSEHPARQLWISLETLHDVTYFAPEIRDAGLALGLRGYWMTYFAFRAAPLGLVGAPVTVATFAGFHPGMVGRALPAAWSRTTPEACIEARAQVATGVLHAVGVDPQACRTAAALLLPAIGTADPTGRALFAANAGIAPFHDPVAQLWQLASTLREHRGDGHVAALVAAGISGLEGHLLQVAFGRFGSEDIRSVRGWSEDEWAAAGQRLIGRGYLQPSGETLTATGQELVDRIEAQTDEAAWVGALAVLGSAVVDEVNALLSGSVDAVRKSGVLPAINPVGLPVV